MSAPIDLRSPKLWVGVFSLTLVFLYVLNSFARTSPGPLTSVHGQLSELQGSSSCSECHGGWFGDMTSSCLECHDPIAQQLQDRTGLHGRLDEALAPQCASCHSEHHGESFSMVNDRSFAMAVGSPREGFDHSKITNWRLSGSHQDIATKAESCSECHEHADAEILSEGQLRFLGLSQTCASCHDEEHQDAHDGQMRRSCAECHDQEQWEEPNPLEHSRVLVLEGGHATLECSACHEVETDRSIDALGRSVRDPVARRCTECHVSPHAESFVENLAALEEHTVDQVCQVCHLDQHMTFRDPQLEELTTADRHACSGFPLDEPHHEAQCSDCHYGVIGPAPLSDLQANRPRIALDTASSDFELRYPGRSPNDCRACHEDVHRGEFDAALYAPQGCVDCHAQTHFLPSNFGVEAHARTGFELTGSHVDTDCRACHVPDAGMSLPRFHTAEAKCSSCHEDAHLGAFDAQRSEFEAAKFGSCAHCHGTESFAEADLANFDHNAHTRFDIHGAHAQADCESCHPRSQEPDETGRRFGRVSDHYGSFQGCATCHEDPHGGVFDREGLPARIAIAQPDGSNAEASDCARCHGEVSFRFLHTDFDHERWTGFALDRAHSKASCSVCHEPLRDATETGRTFAEAKGTSCASCHEDVHRGQFNEGQEEADCARCHVVTTGFDDLVFRHDLHSRFDLGEAHSGLACSACHVPDEIDGRTVIRYRPLPVKCADCHGDATSPFRRRDNARRRRR
ncbi:MAG: cytochrome c3 family protein [Planctomycetota bacterium]